MKIFDLVDVIFVIKYTWMKQWWPLQPRDEFTTFLCNIRNTEHMRKSLIPRNLLMMINGNLPPSCLQRLWGTQFYLIVSSGSGSRCHQDLCTRKTLLSVSVWYADSEMLTNKWNMWACWLILLINGVNSDRITDLRCSIRVWNIKMTSFIHARLSKSRVSGFL